MAELMISGWLVSGFIVLCALVALFDALFRFHPENPADVVAMVRRMKKAELEAMLDPNVEAEFRVRLSRQEFRKEQKKRQKLLFEYVRRLSFNVMIMTGLARSAWSSVAYKLGPRTEKEDHTLAAIRDILQYAIWFRLYYFGALTKLAFRIAFSAILPTRSLSGILDIQRVRGVMVYELITTATWCLVLIQSGPEQSRKFLDALGWPDPRVEQT